MKKALSCFLVLLLYCFIAFGCRATIIAIQNIDAAERAKMCQKLCRKEHYPITVIDGQTGEESFVKISVVSMRKKVVCTCPKNTTG